MDDAGKALTVTEIMAALHRKGHDDARRLVYATLGYLSRKGLAKRNKDGTWVATSKSTRRRKQSEAVAA